MTDTAQPAEQATFDREAWLRGASADHQLEKDAPPPGEDLTEQRRFFCRLYLKTGSKSASYNLAFPGNRKSNTALKEAAKLLSDARVARFIEYLRAQGADYRQVSDDEIRHGLGLIAFADLRKAFDEKGALLPPHRWPQEIAFAAAGYEEKETPAGYTRKLKMPDRNAALRTLAEMNGALRKPPEGAPSASFSFYFGARPTNVPTKGTTKRAQTGRTLDGTSIRVPEGAVGSDVRADDAEAATDEATS